MKRPDLPYLEFKTVKGREYVYFRKGEARIRIKAPVDSEEFAREYWRARNGGTKAPVKTTWAKLIDSYYLSPAFRDLSPGTKRDYRAHCEAIREKNGPKDMRTFRRSQAIAARDALQDTWSKANYRVAVLSNLCRHAVDLEWIERNPVTDIPKLKGGEYKPWPEAKLKAFTKTAEGIARTAFELAYGTGQRIGDCCKMTWADYDGESIQVVQEKTEVQIWVACPARLRAYLDALPKTGKHILAKNLTQHVGKRQVQGVIEEVREMIGAQEFVPHGWRYNAAQELAEAGNSEADIQAVTGHKSTEMVRKYRKHADQRIRSKRAQARRERNKDGT